MRRGRPGRHVVVGVAVLLLALSGCGAAEQRAVPEPTASAVRTASESPAAPASVTASPTVAATASPPPCDPGGGFPRARAGCPDPAPETGWLTRNRDGRLLLAPFRTYGNNAAGKAYAQAHGLEYPFANDYLDAPTGRPLALRLAPDTVCTGIILVGYRDPLGDHVVACAKLRDVAARLRVPVAVWRDGARVVQVSELYRP